MVVIYAFSHALPNRENFPIGHTDSEKKRSLCAAEKFSDPLFCETDIFHTPSLISGKFSEKFHTPYFRNSVVRDFPPKISYPLQNSHKISYPFNFPGKFSDPLKNPPTGYPDLKMTSP